MDKSHKIQSPKVNVEKKNDFCICQQNFLLNYLTGAVFVEKSSMTFAVILIFEWHTLSEWTTEFVVKSDFEKNE